MTTPSFFDRLQETADAVRARVPQAFEWAVVLGSGLDAFAARLEDPVALPFAELPHMPSASVAGHQGRLLIGVSGGRTVGVLQGRLHSYEGHRLDAATYPIRLLQVLGVRKLLLTAATGGIRDDLGPGALVALTDHLNLIGENPLRGPNDDRLGPRFPDMSEVYDQGLRQRAGEQAERLGIDLKTGVYACLPGPSYETPAEIRMLRTLGADVVGMSTVPEAIVARHGGLSILGLACVANWAAGLSPTPLSHEEVLQAGRAVGDRLAALIAAILEHDTNGGVK